MGRCLLAGGVAACALALGAAPALAAFTAQINGSTLETVGNGASDELALRLQAGVPTMLEIDVGDNGSADFTFDRTLFTDIEVTAGGGNDRVRIDQSNGTFTDESVLIDGGAGNDTLLGGSGAEVFVGGAGDDVIDGNQGNDVALLGEDDDTFHWDPGDGSDVVEGQAGSDTLDFAGSNANEQIDVSANGGRVRFFRDIAAITMDLDDVETIGFHALGGTDNVVVNDLTGTDAKTVDVDLAAAGSGGDAAADTVVVNGTAGSDKVRLTRAGAKVQVSGLAAKTRIGGAELANDMLRVQTLAGDDTISVASAVFDLIQTIVDLGPDG